MRTWGMRGLLAATAVAVQALVGVAVVASPTAALVGAGALVTVIVVVAYPLVVASLALPTAFAYWRVGPTDLNLSLADVVLGVAVVAVMLVVPWHSPHLQSLLRVLAAYLVVLAVAIVAEPSTRAVVEWAHRAMLVGGGLCVGAAIGARRLERVALGFYIAVATVFAFDAIALGLGRIAQTGGLPPASYPLGLQKNPGALLIAVAALMLVVVPQRVPVPRALRGPLLMFLFVGVLACQSRGTAIALVVVLVIRVFQDRRVTLSGVTFVGAALLIAMTWVTLDALLQSDAGDSRFNTINSRLETYEDALDLWSTSPITGVGLKYWREPGVGTSEPHNAIVAALGESGVVGLIGLGVLMVGTIVVLRRIRTPLAELALLVLLAKFLASMVDIFWVAGTFTIPWLLIGIAAGAAAADANADRPQVVSRGSRMIAPDPAGSPALP